MKPTTRTSALLFGAALLALAALAPAQVVVDDFSTNQATITDPPGGASTATTAGVDILGLRRGLRVFNLAGAGPTSAGVAAGALSFSVAATTPDSRGEALLIWDGDVDPLTVNPTGLGGVDLTATATQGGFRFEVDSASAGAWMLLTVYEDATHVSRVARALPAIGAPVGLFVDFAELAAAPGAVGPADLTAVGAITLRVGGTEQSIVLSRIATAPPALAASKVDRTPAGAPIPGAGQPGDQIRYRITISNSGGGADGVALTDTLDSNLALVAGSVRTTPLARRDLYRTITSTALDSSASGLPTLLANDVDPDGNSLAAVPAAGQATAQGGTVNVVANGHFVYTPLAGFQGIDSFTYTIAATAGDPTTDAAGNPIAPAVGRATVVIDRVAPVLTAGGTLAYDENDPPTAIDPTITAADADSTNLVSATAQITGNYQNGEDLLSFVNTVNITGSFAAGSGTLTLTGSDTVAAYQAALRAVRYENGSDDPDTGDRTVTWIGSDGVESSAPVTSTIEVTSINDPPVLTAGATLAYTENQAATAIDTTITVADADDTNLVSASAQITGNYVNGQDILACGAPCAGLSPTFVPGTGTLTLTGSATLAAYQTALRGVTYFNNSENPSALNRTVTWIASDGDDPSAPVTSTITVTPVNDPPVVTGESFQTISNTRLRVAATDPGADSNGPYIFAAGNLLTNDTDPDGPSALTTSLGTATAGAVVVVNSDGTFSYTSPAGRTAPDSFTYNVFDGIVNVQGTVSITFLERVWYVRNNATAGGLGRSIDPFDTLVEAQTASGANDWIFVYNGNGTTSGQDAGITLKAGQHLVGEGVGLSIPVALNGGASPVVLVAPGTRPMLDNTTAGGSAVMATDLIPVEIVGLNLAGNTNGVDLTLTGAFAGSGTLTIANNTVRAAGAEGIDVNAGGTGTLTLRIHDNGLTATGTGLDVQRTLGTVQITAFDDNVVSAATGGSGIVLAGPLTFDATPGGAYQQVAGGVTVIGASGDGVGLNGLVMTTVSGDLAFTDLDLFTTNGAALRITGSGAVNVAAGTGTRVTVGAGVGIADATGGPAVDLNNLTAAFAWTTIRSTSTTTTGVSLVSVSDAVNPTFDALFSAGSGSSITTTAGATGPIFNVSGGNAAVSYAGTIANTSSVARAVSITTWAGDDAGDDLLLSGAIDENGAGILLNGNAGARAITFSGGLDIDTTTGEGFAATNNTNTLGLNITGTNTIDSVSATALRVTSTPIGSSHLNFRSLSSGNATAAADPANGVILNATGGTGRLIVAGTGSAGTGGTIQNATSTGISLTSTLNPSFSWMQLNGFGDFAIRGANMAGFNLANSVVNGTNGNSAAADEGSIRFTELTGTATFTSSSVSGGFEDNIRVVNTSGALTATLSSMTIGANSLSDGNDGVYFETLGASSGATMTVSVQNSTFTSSRADLIQVNNNSNGSFDFTFTGNVLSNNHGGIATGGGGVSFFAGPSSTDTFDIQNNTFRDAVGVGVLIVKPTGPGTLDLTFSGNQIGVVATANSGSLEGSALKLQSVGQGAINALITDNQIRWYNNFGIELLTGGSATFESGAFNATITGNTITNPGNNPATAAIAKNGIHLNGGTVPGDTYLICLDAGGAGALQNSLSTSGAPNDSSAGGEDIRLRQRQATTVRLRGYGGASNDNAAVQTYLIGRNGGDGVPSAIASNTVPTGGGYVNTPGGAACPLP